MEVEQFFKEPYCDTSMRSSITSNVQLLTCVLDNIGVSDIRRKSLSTSVGTGTFPRGQMLADFQVSGTVLCLMLMFDIQQTGLARCVAAPFSNHPGMLSGPPALLILHR